MIRISNHLVWVKTVPIGVNLHRVPMPYNSNWRMPCRLKSVMMSRSPQVEVTKVNKNSPEIETLTELLRTQPMSTALMLTTPWRPSSRKTLWLHNRRLSNRWVRPRNLTAWEKKPTLWNQSPSNISTAKDPNSLQRLACITPASIERAAWRIHLAERIDQSCPDKIEQVSFLIW